MLNAGGRCTGDNLPEVNGDRALREFGRINTLTEPQSKRCDSVQVSPLLLCLEGTADCVLAHARAVDAVDDLACI